jgi:hypothetical protein
MGKENLHTAFRASVIFDSAVFITFNRHFNVAVGAEARLIRHNGQTLLLFWRYNFYLSKKKREREGLTF